MVRSRNCYLAAIIWILELGCFLLLDSYWVNSDCCCAFVYLFQKQGKPVFALFIWFFHWLSMCISLVRKGHALCLCVQRWICMMHRVVCEIGLYLDSRARALHDGGEPCVVQSSREKDVRSQFKKAIQVWVNRILCNAFMLLAFAAHWYSGATELVPGGSSNVQETAGWLHQAS